MTIHTALRKLPKLSPAELRHCIQRMDIELKNYERCVRNYSEAAMRRFAIPYQRRLQAQRQQFVDELNRR